MHSKNFLFAILGLVLAACSADATDYSGSYIVNTPDGAITLELEQDPDGIVEGELSDGFMMLELEGESDGKGIRGEAFGDAGAELRFSAMLQADGNLLVTLSPGAEEGYDADVAETLVFAPAGAAAASSPAPAGAAAAAASKGGRQVFINRTRLDDAVLQAMETQYGIPIQDGRYWYDSACGGWGLEGGPTAGFIAAGLQLPGPMPADISGSGTDIFINGREIHQLDQAALQNIFGYTMPGRYWLDAQGYLGQEGGPALTNLAMAMQAAQQTQSGSVTHGYDTAGGARGTVAGGMYSGRTATGKSVLWYPGM